MPSNHCQALVLTAALVLTTAHAGSLQEAIQIREELAPVLCRLRTLERDMRAIIQASGQTPHAFFARSSDDPDPRVQQAMAITREIQALGDDNAKALKRARELVASLSPADRDTLADISRQASERCPN
jgi:hypothetical protein